MGDWAWLPIVVGGIATLAIYSFLIKENPFYRFFEHLYIGIATGFGIVLALQRFLWPQLFRPMLGYDREVFANGTFDRPWRECLQLLASSGGGFVPASGHHGSCTGRIRPSAMSKQSSE